MLDLDDVEEVAASIVKERLHASAIVLARVEVPSLIEELRAARMVIAAARKIQDDPWSGHLGNMVAHYDAVVSLHKERG